MCLESDAGFTQSVEERLFLACFGLPCQSAACAHLRGNRDHASGQTALREHGFCRERLLGGRKRDDRKRPFAAASRAQNEVGLHLLLGDDVHVGHVTDCQLVGQAVVVETGTAG